MPEFQQVLSQEPGLESPWGLGSAVLQELSQGAELGAPRSSPQHWRGQGRLPAGGD